MRNKYWLLLLLGGGVLIIAGGIYLWRGAEEVTESAGGKSSVVFPIEEYAIRRTVNAFGEESQVTLEGYHVGDDIEYTDTQEEVLVFAIADGVVRRADWVGGYGGVVVIAHTIEGNVFTALYGHVDLSSVSVSPGERVGAGQHFGNLGEGGTAETDGERKHLHFAIYEGQDSRIQGYESAPGALLNWLNPHDFFAQYGLDTKSSSRRYNSQEELGGEDFALEFLIPEAWEVEYDEEARVLNMFTLSGEGSARERSQIMFTYFDAEQFLTLSTVTIHEVVDTTVGQEDYTAKRYDIEKRAGTPAFEGQPSWRNERHIAIDFRKEEGRTRYYSIAKNPALDDETFQRVLSSIRIVP